MQPTELNRLVSDVYSWKQLRESFPDAYRSLVEVAGSTPREQEIPVPAEAQDAIASISIDVEGLSPTMVLAESSARQAQLLAFVEDRMAPALREPASFCKAIWDLADTAGGDRLLAYRFALLALCLVHGQDLLSIVAGLAQDQDCMWEISPAFWVLLPRLDPDPNVVATCLPAIHDAVGSDLTAGVFRNSVEEYARLHPQRAEDAIAALIEQRTETAAVVASCLIVGASRAKPRHMVGLALPLTESKHTEIASSAIVALSNMDYGCIELDGQLERFIERLHSLEDRMELVPATSLAYCNLGRRNHIPHGKLIELSKHEMPIARHHVSGLIAGQDWPADERWPVISLMNLAKRTELSQQGTLENLDFAVARLVVARSPAAYRFLTLWVLEHPDALRNQPIHESFGSTFFRLLELRSPLEYLVTAWMNTEFHPLHMAAAQMIREASLRVGVRQGSPLKLSSQLLRRLSSTSRIFILRKVLGWVYGIDNTCLFVLAFSILQDVTANELLESHVAALFGSALGYDYPRLCEEFLTGPPSSGSPAEQRVAERALRSIRNYRQARESLPHLKELAPPADRIARFDREIAKAFARSYKREREERPGLLQLASTSTLKYRCPYALMGPQGKLLRGEMQEHSVTAEMPRGDSIAPIGHTVMRLKFRSETKDEVRDELSGQ